MSKDKLGEDVSAIRNYDRATEFDHPNDAIAYYNSGTSKTQSGDHAGAIEDYDRAIELAPDYASAYYNRAIGLAPDFVTAYNNRGVSKAKSRNPVSAIQDYDCAIFQPI